MATNLTAQQVDDAIARAKADNNEDAVAELQAIRADIDRDALIRSQKKRMDEMSTTDWLKETAKTASTQGLAFLSAGGQMLIDKTAPARGQTPSGKGFFEVYEENQATAQQLLRDIGLYDKNKYSEAELRAGDPSGGLGTAAVGAMSDFTSYMGMPVSKQLVKTGANILGRSAESGVGGMLSDVGGRTGEALDPNNEYGGSFIGSFLGGSLAPATTIPTRTAVQSVASNLYDRVVKSADQFDAEIANKDAMSLLKNISGELGEGNIDKLISDFNKVRGIIGDEGLPTFVALGESEALRADFIRLVKRNPEARAKLDAEIQRLVTKIEDNADTLFGSRAVSVIKNAPIDPEVAKAASAAERAQAAIDARLFSLGEGLPRVEGDNLGLQVQGLVVAKSKAVRTAMTAEYDELADAGRKAGVLLPSSSTQALYDFVTENNLRDIFGRTSSVDKKIMSYLAPKTTTAEPSPIIIPRGRTAPEPSQPKTTREFKPMTYDNVISLKNEVNRLLLEAKDPKTRMQLNQLKQVLREQRKNLPGEWDQRLSDLDKSYYERIGVPLNNKAMEDITSREYAEKVAPILLNNVTAAKTFMETIGPEAVPVLKATILSKLHDASVKGGKINEASFRNNLARYQDVIRLVPGLRGELDDLAMNNAQGLRDFKAAQDQVARTAADLESAKLLSADPNLGLVFSDVARNLDNPTKFVEWQKEVGRLDAKTQKLLNDRLRREVIAQATQSPKGTVGFLSDPNKIPVMSKLFNTSYVKDLEAVATLSDMVRRMDPNKIKFSPDADENNWLKKNFGVTDKQAFSVLRDRIASVVQKAAILFSKSNETRVQNAKDRKMLELMLDPDAVKQLANLVDERGNFKSGAMEGLARMQGALSERILGLSLNSQSRETSRQASQDEMEAYRQQFRAPQPVR